MTNYQERAMERLVNQNMLPEAPDPIIKPTEPSHWAKGQKIYYTTNYGWAVLCELDAVDYKTKMAVVRSIEQKDKNFPLGHKIRLKFDVLNNRATLHEDSDVQKIIVEKIVEKPVIKTKEVIVEKEVKEVIPVYYEKQVKLTTLISPPTTTWIDKLYQWYWELKGRDVESIENVLIAEGMYEPSNNPPEKLIEK